MFSENMRTSNFQHWLNHNIYGIKNTWDTQLQHHISNFINRLNDANLLKTTTHIRLQQLQNNLWSTTNIISSKLTKLQTSISVLAYIDDTL